MCDSTRSQTILKLAGSRTERSFRIWVPCDAGPDDCRERPARWIGPLRLRVLSAIETLQEPSGIIRLPRAKEGASRGYPLMPEGGILSCFHHIEVRPSAGKRP